MTSMPTYGTYGPGAGGNTNFPGGSSSSFMDLIQNSGPFGQNQDFMQSFAQSPQQLPEGYAYNPATGMAQQVGGGFYGPTHQFRYDPNEPQGVTGSEQMQAAILGDYGQMVDANQFNYQQTQNAIGNFEQSIMGGADDIRQAGQRAQDQMFGFADEIQAVGQRQYDERQAQVDEVMAGFEDYSAAMSSSVSAGLASQNRSRAAQNMAGIKTGDPNAIQAQQQLEMESNMQRAQTMVNLGSQFNQTRASLGMQGVGMMNQAAATQQGYESIASNVNTMGVQFAQAAEAQAAQFEAQGLGQVAQMVAANPYNPISFAQSLASFFQFTQTPGSDSFAGFADELLFT